MKTYYIHQRMCVLFIFLIRLIIELTLLIVLIEFDWNSIITFDFNELPNKTNETK